MFKAISEIVGKISQLLSQDSFKWNSIQQPKQMLSAFSAASGRILLSLMLFIHFLFPAKDLPCAHF